MRTKVKVKRVELVKIVDGRLRKAEREYERAKTAYPKKEAQWRADVVAWLEKALANAKNGGLTRDQYHYGVKLPDQPTRPSEGRDLCNLRRMLTTLKIGAEDTILLSQEDADHYFGPCKL